MVLVTQICLVAIYVNKYIYLTAGLETKSSRELSSNNNISNNGIFRTTGIFGSFLKIFLDTLLNFPTADNKLAIYIKILSKCLREMGYKYTKKMSAALKKLSKEHVGDIKHEIKQYREDLEAKLSHRVKFLNAMDSIFTPESSLLLYDYTKQLKIYSEVNDSSIYDDTRTLLNYAILNKVLQLSYGDQDRLRTKLKNAIKEYNGWSVSSLFYSKESSLSSSDDTSEELSSDYNYGIYKFPFGKGKKKITYKEIRPIIVV